MSAADVVQRLISTAQDLGPAGRDRNFGFGLVDPVAALTAEVAPVPANQLDTAPPPGRDGFGAAPDTPQRTVSPSATPVLTAEPGRPGSRAPQR
jgi:hypothetical protein